MYEELVKRLRERATWINFPHHGEEFPTEDAKLMMEAADAIEELQKQVEDYECRLEISPEAEYAIDKHCDDIISRMDKLIKGLDDKPRWIPVTERLPEPKFAREWYLVTLESGCVKSLAYEKEGRTDNLFRPGWHETASPVTHWMPLPEPPKEET